MTYSIKVLDQQHNNIGELMTASADDIMKFLNKGFIVIHETTNQPITQESLMNMMGVSDGVIEL